MIKQEMGNAETDFCNNLHCDAKRNVKLCINEEETRYLGEIKRKANLQSEM